MESHVTPRTPDNSIRGGRPKWRDQLSMQDRIEIQDIVSLPTLYVDLGDYQVAAQFYVKDAILDYSSVLGPAAQALPVERYWASVLQFMPGFDSSLHQITNFDISMEGEAAVCISAVRATLRIGEETYSNGGIYRHTLVRTAEGWRISHQSYRKTFEEGASLLEKARARLAK
jgi:hypothetical protein